MLSSAWKNEHGYLKVQVQCPSMLPIVLCKDISTQLLDRSVLRPWGLIWCLA